MWDRFRKRTKLNGRDIDVEPAYDWKIGQEGESEGKCDCCRNVSRLIWGSAVNLSGYRVKYSVHWTVGQSKKTHPANFDFIVSETKSGGFSVAMLLFENDDGSPGVMVINAADRPSAGDVRVQAALSRDEVVGTPIATQMFAVFDAIWLHDTRVSELTGNS